MSTGLFLRALQRGEAHEVAMDEVRFFAFTGASLRSVGTRNLNGCTAIMIVSEYGAILAHIPPQPAPTRNDSAGDQHCAEKMTEVATDYRTNIQYFPAEKPSWIVSALWEGEIALPSQRQIIEEKLREMGLNPASANYKAVSPPQSENNTKGSVFIDARGGGLPQVYVEDVLVSPASARGVANISARTETGGGVGSQTAQMRPQPSQPSQSSQQNALQRVYEGLLKAENQEDFVQMAKDLHTRFKGQPADFQSQFLEAVKRAREERQRRE